MNEALNTLLKYFYEHQKSEHRKRTRAAFQFHLNLKGQQIETILAQLSREGYIHSFFREDFQSLTEGERIYFQLSRKGKKFLQSGGYQTAA